MNAGTWLKIIMVAAGFFVLWMTLLSLAKRKFTDGFSMLWFVLSVCMVAAGIVIQPDGISKIISNTGLALGIIIGLVFLCLAWWFSLQISVLIRRNHELAMQVSLLNHDFVKLQRALKELSEKEAAKQE